MNHLGNTNKMVDTPMTDDQECDMFVGVSTFTPSDIQQAFDFARQLERELNAANNRIKRLEEESESRWMLAQSATGSCAEMSSRIKRLEEAGNALAKNHLLVVTTYDKAKAHVADWRKAKEDKP